MSAIELRASAYHISVSATLAARGPYYTYTMEIHPENSSSNPRPSFRDLWRNRYSRRHIFDTDGEVRLARQFIADARERGDRIPGTHETLAMGTLGHRTEFAIEMCEYNARRMKQAVLMFLDAMVRRSNPPLDFYFRIAKRDCRESRCGDVSERWGQARRNCER
jgi:hypothetical protein